ncbi:hypothetical protein BC628DRAFT_766950 [Trametes gibbosa]|nr:hypothetical protein BC628DRAFT_766950 [Trametes gibbosa]
MLRQMPEPQYVARNPFIVLRFVLFAILVYVNILTIGFAVWNVTVLKSLTGQALGAPAFVIFNSCILLALLGTCLISAWYSLSAFDRVRNECGWTGFLSVLQLASSIDITVNGPPTLCQGVSILACASSSLCVALSWVSSTILLLYSFSLLTSAITHMNVVPDVWASSVRSIPWFMVPSDCLESRASSEEKPRYSDVKRSSLHFSTPIFAQHAKALPCSPISTPTTPSIWQAHRSSVTKIELPALPPPSSKRTTWTNHISVLSHKCSTESVLPSWAKREATGRRGIVQPFAVPRQAPVPRPLVLPTIRPLDTPKLKSCWSQSTASASVCRSPIPTAPSALGSPPPPALPSKAHVAGWEPSHGAPAPRLSCTGLSPTSTFYIDLERDAGVVVPLAPAPGRPVSYGMFPEDVVDPDAPITRAQRSEWVRAVSPAFSSPSRGGSGLR